MHLSCLVACVPRFLYRRLLLSLPCVFPGFTKGRGTACSVTLFSRGLIQRSLRAGFLTELEKLVSLH